MAAAEKFLDSLSKMQDHKDLQNIISGYKTIYESVKEEDDQDKEFINKCEEIKSSFKRISDKVYNEIIENTPRRNKTFENWIGM